MEPEFIDGRLCAPPLPSTAPIGTYELKAKAYWTGSEWTIDEIGLFTEPKPTTLQEQQKRLVDLQLFTGSVELMVWGSIVLVVGLIIGWIGRGKGNNRARQYERDLEAFERTSRSSGRSSPSFPIGRG